MKIEGISLVNITTRVCLLNYFPNSKQELEFKRMELGLKKYNVAFRGEGISWEKNMRALFVRERVKTWKNRSMTHQI